MSGWANSNRRAELPADWPSIRQQVKRRADGRCEAISHEPECIGIGSECDHIGDPHDHSLPNLQWLSAPCHRAKTIRERPHVPSRKRTPPPHPGVTT